MEKLAALVPPPRLLQRVFAIDMARCPRGHQGTLRPLAAIPYRPSIGRILRHLNLAAAPPPSAEAHLEQACCACASPSTGPL